MTRLMLGFVLAIFLLFPDPVLAQASKGEWLVGTWEGELLAYAGAGSPKRTLKIVSVAADGAALGTWFVTGREEYLARIRMVDDDHVKVVTVVETVVDLKREGESGLDGTFVLAKGAGTYRVSLKRVSGASEPATAKLEKALLGRWEGEVRNVYRITGDTTRVLFIESVTRTSDGQASAQGRYGITTKAMGRVSMQIDESGNAPEIRFTTGANSTVRLNVQGARDLVGAVKYMGAGAGPQNEEAMRLRRVD